MFNKKDERGLLLIEIIVVVLIIAFMSLVIIIGMDVSRKRAKDAVIRSDLEQIQVIAETVYNPQTQYKELYDMRQSEYFILKRIKERMVDIGRDGAFKLHFPEDSLFKEEVFGYSQYCAYVQLFMNPKEIFCVDSEGRAQIMEVSPTKEINCQSADFYPYNCEYK